MLAERQAIELQLWEPVELGAPLGPVLTLAALEGQVEEKQCA
ncbi:MAG: hypothetical protein ACYDAY_11515 [Candidatus Dormibacteria bacterium]